MKKTFYSVLAATLFITLTAAFSSCMLMFPAHYDTHTVTINLSSSPARFADKEEAIAYSNYYEIRLYQYQNGEIMKKPCLTTVLTDKDLSFTCDTGYYYLEMDAWAEETGTVVTGHGSTLNTESFDDGVKVNAGVFELSYEQRNVTVTLEIKAAPESEYPVWNITWNTDGGEFVQDDTYTVDTTFDWRRMYPLTETAAKMNPFPSSARISRQTGELADALVGWYLTPDFSDSPITSFQQLPLKSVTLYARWAPAVSIDSDIEFDDFIAFSLEDLTSTPDSPSKTIKAFPAEGNWPENATFVWLVDGVQVAGSSDTFTYTFTPCIHTVTCIVNGTSSESITVECVENN